MPGLSKGGNLTQRQKPKARDEVRTAVRFPLKLALQLKTEDGVAEATTRNISSNGLLFESNFIPQVGSRIEFTMELPSEVMGLDNNVSVQCSGRVVRHQRSDKETMIAAVIDEYTLRV